MSNYYFLWLCTEQWELIYYVAFIILTIGLVIFAAKTYFFQTKQSTKLFCKSIEKPAASGNSNLYVEVYNYGNAVAQNINVKIQNVERNRLGAGACVKMRGSVSDVTAAMDAALKVAEPLTKIFSHTIIASPAHDTEPAMYMTAGK